MASSRPMVLLLMGATATGKTDLAVKIAERFPVELISVDSALIYRDMDIGTAKPAPEILNRAPHHLIDIIDPAQTFSVWDFMQQAQSLIQDIHDRGRIPLLVGGTMMYFNALKQGMHELPVANPAIREQLNARLQTEGLDRLYVELQEIDPEMAERLRPGDTQRILRALEVYTISGVPMSALQQQNRRGPELEFREVILEAPERADLHERIAKRFHMMLDQGFVQEVERLQARGDLSLELPSMRCVGYRQVWMYLQGDYDRAAMTERGIIATRQLAKRQITWLRKYQEALHVSYASYDDSDVFKFFGLYE